MFDPYGPWSSTLGDGLSPHLSTFWKCRLGRLASARAARPLLTRRDWLKLLAAGAAVCAVPTLHLATASRPDDAKPAVGKIYVHATLKADNGDEGWNTGIFAIDPVTAAWIKVSDFQGTVRVSPDGGTLALSRAGRTGADFHEIENVGVWTLDAKGKGTMHRVADFGGTMSWSPDSKQLIVAKWLYQPGREESRDETWRFNADGSGATRLPIPETDEVDDWSPDGKWLVTVSDRHPPHGSGYQLYLMRPDGTGQRRLTGGGGLNVYPRFSPDSRQVVYTHQERGENSLWVVNIDGTSRRRVVQEENDTSPEYVCWSPDGKSLAYTMEDWQRNEKGKKILRGGNEANPRMAIIDGEGKNPRPLGLPRAQWLGAPDWR